MVNESCFHQQVFPHTNNNTNIEQKIPSPPNIEQEIPFPPRILSTPQALPIPTTLSDSIWPSPDQIQGVGCAKECAVCNRIFYQKQLTI